MTDSENSLNQPDQKGFQGPKVFGRRIFRIPCFKEALKTSVLSGIGFGLVNFWFTSDVPRSTRKTFIVMLLAHPISWFYCRRKFKKDFERLQQEKQLNPSPKPSFLRESEKNE